MSDDEELCFPIENEKGHHERGGGTTLISLSFVSIGNAHSLEQMADGRLRFWESLT